MYFANSNFISHLLCNTVIITGKHYQTIHAGCFELFHGFCRMWLDDIRNQNMSCIYIVNDKMHDCSHTVTRTIFNAKLFHQFVIAGCHLVTINRCDHTMSADFLYIGHTGVVKFLSICLLQAHADWMCTVAFRQSRIFQKMLFLCRIFRLTGSIGFLMFAAGMLMDTTYFKYTLRNRSCFIKDNCLCLCQSLQIIRSFDKNTCSTRSTNSCKETKRNTDNKSTRTTDNKECQCPVYPLTPVCRKSHKNHAHKWRNNRQCECTVTYCRCIIMCKF